MSKIKLVL